MTNTPFHLVGIGGANREGSNTLLVLRHLLRLAESKGATTDLIDVHTVRLPVYEPEVPREQQPQALLDLLPILQRADGFILASPTYHGTVSGGVKNLLDSIDLFGSDERGSFAGRPVGVAAYGGPGAINTLNALHHSARGLSGFVVPTVFTVGWGGVTTSAEFPDDATRERAATLIDEILSLASMQRLALAQSQAAAN
ncbi:MAG: NAD(P)H-dependent oxidoreductase [Thermomicrobiales bacterium]